MWGKNLLGRVEAEKLSAGGEKGIRQISQERRILEQIQKNPYFVRDYNEIRNFLDLL